MLFGYNSSGNLVRNLSRGGDNNLNYMIPSQAEAFVFTIVLLLAKALIQQMIGYFLTSYTC